MDHDPSGPFVTSILELKLDPHTMFEWQKHSQDQVDVPHYQNLLDFLDLRAQASETLVTESQKKFNKSELSFKRNMGKIRPIASYTVSAINTTPPSHCIICKTDKHPLYLCSQFKALTHPENISLLKSNDICMNCLKPGRGGSRPKS